MFYNINEIMKKYEDNFVFTKAGKDYGRCYYILWKAIDSSLTNKKVSIIFTKNKERFLDSIIEIVRKNPEIEMTEYKNRNYYDITFNNVLIVKIIEENE